MSGKEEDVKRVRLVKVIVQPVVVVDDGETLTEHVADPLVVPAKEWGAFDSEGFQRAMAGLSEQLLSQADGPVAVPDSEAPPASEVG